MYQYEAVEHVMEENGGFSTLKHLYERAPQVEGSKWKTKTPNASIRRIVQDREGIFRIRPGLWALEAYQDELPESVYDESSSPEEQEAHDHWYFQGLLAETGDALGADVWVPSQDKNREFLTKTLDDVRSMERIPPFGYDEVVQRASTVDVIWFNERRMPNSFIEVEFSTDFQNSLHKFLDLQDYHANFIIAASDTRRRQFEKRVNQAGFEPIRDRVDFFDFDKVAKEHAASVDVGNLPKRFGL